jgi:hypothetical protein
MGIPPNTVLSPDFLDRRPDNLLQFPVWVILHMFTGEKGQKGQSQNEHARDGCCRWDGGEAVPEASCGSNSIKYSHVAAFNMFSAGIER